MQKNPTNEKCKSCGMPFTAYLLFKIYIGKDFKSILPRKVSNFLLHLCNLKDVTALPQNSTGLSTYAKAQSVSTIADIFMLFNWAQRIQHYMVLKQNWSLTEPLPYLWLLTSGPSSLHSSALGCQGFWAGVLIGYLCHPLFHLLQALQDGHPELGIYRNERWDM